MPEGRNPRDGYEQRRNENAPAFEKGLVIEPGRLPVTPGGYHVMLMDLKSPLKQGEKPPITLEFEKAGKVTVSFDVEWRARKDQSARPMERRI